MYMYIYIHVHVHVHVHVCICGAIVYWDVINVIIFLPKLIVSLLLKLLHCVLCDLMLRKMLDNKPKESGLDYKCSYYITIYFSYNRIK